ncbi:hypothetical protein TRVA0_004S04588 [Trichomonascus vanleenenianus]|uniref:uncharacterized protein n=1 Tax=Trichomonascus vanleenenianus TaxID=2268995 RepID=UPI003EC9B250
MANNCQEYGYVPVNPSGQGKRSGPSDSAAPNKRVRYEWESEDVPCEDPWQQQRQKSKIVWSEDLGFVVKKILERDNIAQLKHFKDYKQEAEPHRGHARGEALREEFFECIKSALKRRHWDWRSGAIENVLEIARKNGMSIDIGRDDYDCYFAYYMGRIVFDKDGNIRARDNRHRLDKFMHWVVSGKSLEPIVALLKGYEIRSNLLRPHYPVFEES